MTKQLIKGNVAAVKGALLAGCRAFYGYPITPASEIAEAAAVYFPEPEVSSCKPKAKWQRSIWCMAPRLPGHAS